MTGRERWGGWAVVAVIALWLGGCEGGSVSRAGSSVTGPTMPTAQAEAPSAPRTAQAARKQQPPPTGPSSANGVVLEFAVWSNTESDCDGFYCFGPKTVGCHVHGNLRNDTARNQGVTVTFRAFGREGSEVAHAETKRVFVKARGRAHYSAELNGFQFGSEGRASYSNWITNCDLIKAVEIVSFQVAPLT